LVLWDGLIVRLKIAETAVSLKKIMMH